MRPEITNVQAVAWDVCSLFVPQWRIVFLKPDAGARGAVSPAWATVYIRGVVGQGQTVCALRQSFVILLRVVAAERPSGILASEFSFKHFKTLLPW
jgi:hypothetical protein